MEASNKPNDKLLEETLYRKIEGSQLMKFDLSRYESAIEGDEDRSYKYLLNMIKKHVKKKLEERLIRDKEKAVINMIGGNPKATPAQGEDSPNPKATLRRSQKLHRLRQRPSPKAKATPATVDPFFYSDDEDDPFEVGAVKIEELKSFNVVFAGDVNITEIEVEDYGNKPKYHRKDPNRPIKKISTESLTDEQTRVENSLANVRARARAIIMDQSDDYKDVHEVHIIIGPKYDAKITIDEDDEADSLEFKESLIEHSGKYFKRNGNIMCISMPILERDRRRIQRVSYRAFWEILQEERQHHVYIDAYSGERSSIHTRFGKWTRSHFGEKV
eukprot:s4782_g2.t1